MVCMTDNKLIICEKIQNTHLVILLSYVTAIGQFLWHSDVSADGTAHRSVSPGGNCQTRNQIQSVSEQNIPNEMPGRQSHTQQTSLLN